MTSYKIGGMTCDGCVRAVTAAVKRLAPKAEISVDLAAGRVSIAEDVPDMTVKKAVEDAGFDYFGRA